MAHTTFSANVALSEARLFYIGSSFVQQTQQQNNPNNSANTRNSYTTPATAMLTPTTATLQ